MLFGSLGVGVTLVPVSPLFTPAEVARVREDVQERTTPEMRLQVLQMARPRLLVTTDPLVPLLVAAQEGAGGKGSLLLQYSC